MYMRITKGLVRPGCWDAYEAAYRQHVETLTPVNGLRGRWLVRSKTDPGLGFSLSLWETLTDMELYERSDAVKREILPHLAPFLSNNFVAHHCAVTVQCHGHPK